MMIVTVFALLFILTCLTCPYFLLLVIIEYVSVVLVFWFLSQAYYISPSLFLVIFVLIFESVLYSCIVITNKNM